MQLSTKFSQPITVEIENKSNFKANINDTIINDNKSLKTLADNIQKPLEDDHSMIQANKFEVNLIIIARYSIY